MNFLKGNACNILIMTCCLRLQQQFINSTSLGLKNAQQNGIELTAKINFHPRLIKQTYLLMFTHDLISLIYSLAI